ncbi:beta-1,4-mannosyltransferase&|uniref:Beta-1,4-mannosyltransferase n=1 Tax=Flavimobilis marinus TaxID=285351 RepID=A0A1I2HCK3_9MICO|nr:glycosyltransferase [Flavimobilis marinus]SFF27289.1 beta-1,4-mannosyltransferase&\
MPHETTDHRPDVAGVTVLQSLSRIRETTNPYLVQLLASLPGDVRIELFSWRRALLGRYDVLHVHWPEVIFRRSTRWKTIAARSLYALLLARLRLTRTALVRTAHNVEPYEGADRVEQRLIDATDRATTWWVTLNDFTPLPPGALSRMIPLGCPPETYSARPASAPVPGRLVHFGLMRRYKGIEELIAAFRTIADPAASLHLVGRCDDPGFREVIEREASKDDRVVARLEHVSDADLADEVADAELVVLPYRAMHNSSALILALSMARPVLVPSNDVTRAIAAEVGQAWVQRYEGALEPGALLAALAAAREARTEPDPDLSRRRWSEIGLAHGEVYRAAASRRQADGAGTRTVIR